MKPFKFRVWDNEIKEFDNDIIMRSDGSYGVYDINGDFKDFSFKYKEFLEISYSTGLLDKNGKEVFEGDYVDIKPCKNSLIARIDWDQRDTKYVFRFEEYRVNIDDILITNKSADWFWPQNLEIIGNKFENPELLEEVK